MSTWLRSIEPPSEDSEWIDWGRAILCVYLLASIPWRIAFCPDFSLTIQYPGFIIIDLLATIFFSYDTLCIAKLYWESPHQGSIIPTTITHIKEPKIKHNRQSFDEMLMLKQKRSNRSMWRVLLSCAATIPFEYASILFGGEWLANYFMANRLLRLFYLKDYLECLSIVLGKKGHFKNIGVRRTWALFFFMALAGHLCGCGFYYVARKEAENGFVMTWPEIARIYTIESKMNSKGSHQAELIMESTLFEAYIKSLYWAYITMVRKSLFSKIAWSNPMYYSYHSPNASPTSAFN